MASSVCMFRIKCTIVGLRLGCTGSLSDSVLTATLKAVLPRSSTLLGL
jgi:hypothetical protein